MLHLAKQIRLCGGHNCSVTNLIGKQVSVGRALKEMQIKPDIPGGAEGIPFALAITETEFARQVSRPSSARLSYGYALLDLSDIIRSVRRAAVNVGGVNDTDFGLELTEWAKHNGGYIRGGHPLRPEVSDDGD